jgi:hypothetical protein
MTSRELFLEKILISEAHVQIVQSAGYQITSHAVAQLPLSPREQPAQIRNRPAAILSNACHWKNILFFFTACGTMLAAFYGKPNQFNLRLWHNPC